jgi:hypothetical protein
MNPAQNEFVSKMFIITKGLFLTAAPTTSKLVALSLEREQATSTSKKDEGHKSKLARRSS